MSVVAGLWAYLQTAIRANIKDERGASLVEYALLLALIVIVCLAAISLIGNTTNNTLSKTASALEP